MSPTPIQWLNSSGGITASISDSGDVCVSTFDPEAHLNKTEAFVLGKRLIEMAEYEPAPWVPGPGELLRVSEGDYIYLRLVADRPNCPKGSFSDVGLSRPCLGEPGTTSIDPYSYFTPATWADVQEANEDDE